MMLSMKKLMALSIFAVTICCAFDVIEEKQKNGKTFKYASLKLVIAAKRVFRYAFNPNIFYWAEGDFGGGEKRPTYRYVPHLKDGVDLPQWLKYKYSRRHKAGFIFGVPSAATKYVELDVTAINLLNYEFGLLRLSINVTENADQARFGVRLKIDNLNLEDVFDAHRLRNLKDIFRQRLWTESASDLHMTSISSAPEAGYRRPLKPSLKDGVVLSLGSESAANFSSELFDLDRETGPLRGLPSCPPDFKRTTVERHFRAMGFALDWCEFRLVRLQGGVYVNVGENLTSEVTPEIILPEKINQGLNESLLMGGKRIVYPDKSKLPSKDWTSAYVIITLATLCVAAAILTLFVVSFFVNCAAAAKDDDEGVWRPRGDREALLASFMLVIKDCVNCCEVREKESNLVRADDEFQHNRQRATSVQRQTDTLRRLAQQRDVTPRLQQQQQQQLQQPQPLQSLSSINNYNNNISPSVVGVTENPHFQSSVNFSSDEDDLEEEREDLGAMQLQHYRLPEDPLGSLRRPVPPPYYDQREDVVDTYLV